MNPSQHTVGAAAVSVGALASLGNILTQIEPVLASLSYIAAIAVALVTIYYKIRDKK
jgi:hypothetical protein